MEKLLTFDSLSTITAYYVDSPIYGTCEPELLLQTPTTRELKRWQSRLLLKAGSQSFRYSFALKIKRWTVTRTFLLELTERGPYDLIYTYIWSNTRIFVSDM
ncbi:MAG TPA: hypothetical protein VED16_00910 [Candidatus Acidoferrum sp.]|nr:hypothetical protein [Candidatus Acidoferrum sp.]